MINDTQIFKLLDEYDALPSQPSWVDLDNKIQEKFRELETMFTEGKSDAEIKIVDDELVQKFNAIYGETDENSNKEVQEEKVQELSNNNEQETTNTESTEENNKLDDKKEEVVVDKVVNNDDEIIDSELETKKEIDDNKTDKEEPEIKKQEEETDNSQQESKIQEEEIENQKQESGNVVENIENQNNEEMENTNNDENIQVTTETENEAAKMLEDLEKEPENVKKVQELPGNNEKQEPITENNKVTEKTEDPEQKQEPEPYAEFIQFAMTRELISSKDLLQFNIPPELWHEDKEEIQIGSLILRKTNPSQLMFNRWTVIKK